MHDRHAAEMLSRYATYHLFMEKVLTLILVLSFLVAEYALSCSDMPYEYQVRYYELIERTENIVLANVSRIDTLNNSHLEYHFRTVENLRGDRYTNSFSLTYPINETIAARTKNDDFDKHRSRDFWGLRNARTQMDSDCRLYPIFQAGDSYLLFLGEKDHRRGYELIKSENDLWLEVVRKVLDSQNFSYRYTKNVFEWLETIDAILVNEYVEHGEEFLIRKKEQIYGDNYEIDQDDFNTSEEDYGNFLMIVYRNYGSDGEDLTFPYSIENGVIDFHFFPTEYEVTDYKNITLNSIRQHFKK